MTYWFDEKMRTYPDSKLLWRVGFRRKALAFLTVASAFFFAFCLLWPLSVRSWQSQSEIAVSLTKRADSDEQFQHLLHEVVQRHTTVEAIERILVQNGLSSPDPQLTPFALAKRVRERMNIRLVHQDLQNGEVKLKLGLSGVASTRENFFVNALATTLAQDFMLSPLASLLPEDGGPDKAQIASLEQRRDEIHQRANALLAQIEGNYGQSQQEFVSDQQVGGWDSIELAGEPSLEDRKSELERELRYLIQRRSDEENRSNVLSWDADDITKQIEQKRTELAALMQPATVTDSPFHVASYRRPGSGGAEAGTSSVSGLRDAVESLASIASEATLAARSAGQGPAFSIQSVRGTGEKPVGAIPPKAHLWLLTLAACAIAGIVAAAYQPFASRGFDDVDSVSQRLRVPVVAALDNRHIADESTGGIPPSDHASGDLPQANNMVKACEWILFAGLMLVIGFCLANGEIRDSFMQNPFHGFARIVWVLQGN